MQGLVTVLLLSLYYYMKEEIMKEITPKNLFSTTFFLSAFTIGGGYTIIPLLQDKIVNENKWISEDEMLDIIAIGQSTPGAIAVNVSVLFGYKLKGLKGALIAVLGTALPPLLIMTFVSMNFKFLIENPIFEKMFKGMQIAVAIIILQAVINMFKTAYKNNKQLTVILGFLCFILVYFFSISITTIVLATIAFSMISSYLSKEKNI